MPGRVLVCGGRDYADYARLCRILNDEAPDVIIEGGADGADYLAYRYAKEHGVKHIEAAANWNRYGNAAGHIRNQQMLDYFTPDRVVAFPGNKGTGNMISKALKADIPVRDVSKECQTRAVKKKPSLRR